MIKKNQFLSCLATGLLLCNVSCDDEMSSSTTPTDSSSTSSCETEGVASQSSDTEIEALRTAMVAFRASLSSTLLEQASNCLDDERFTTWTNTPNTEGTLRDGITYGDLSEAQLTAFKEILAMFLSTDGYEKVKLITEEAEGLLSNVQVPFDSWNPDYYSIDMFGDPATDGSWGFQLDGHHCAINFLVNGDTVSMVPAFIGGEPAEWNDALYQENGIGQGYDYNIFSAEKEAVIALYDGMSESELDASSSSTDAAYALVVGPPSEGDQDAYGEDYDYSSFTTGLQYSAMSAASQANLETLMKEHVYNLADSFADAWWEDIEANISDTYFKIILVDGEAPSTESQFYYRIYNPYLWVEFNLEDSTGANAETIDSWNHAHSITRIPNNPTENEAGGDYGTFAMMLNQSGPKTLFEHYAMSDHHNASALKFDYKVKASHIHTH